MPAPTPGGAGSGHDDGPGFGHGRPGFDQGAGIRSGSGNGQGFGGGQFGHPGQLGHPGQPDRFGHPGQPVQPGQPGQSGRPGEFGQPGRSGRPAQAPQPGQAGYGSASGQFARQPGRARSRGKLIAAIVAALVVLAVVGVGGWLLASKLRGDDAAPRAAAWAVGSCLRQTAGPASIAPSTDPDKKRTLEAQRQFQPVGCDDAQALAKIEALGVRMTSGAEVPADDGCPDNTDEAYLIRGIAADADQVVCGRLVKGPHPGDPGGGGGKVVSGDCVVVLSTGNQRGKNDEVAEDPCAGDHWAKVLATAADAAGCTAAGTLSRIPLPGRAGVVLCLGRADDRSGIAEPGGCIDVSQEPRVPPIAAGCGSRASLLRFEAFADGAGKCPGGSTARTSTGYDRRICTRSAR